MKYAVYYLNHDDPSSAVIIPFDELEFYEAWEKDKIVEHLSDETPGYRVEVGSIVHVGFSLLVD